MLEFNNIYAKIGETPVLKGLSLQIGKGQIHAIMGPNGAGKSTLAKVLAGHPDYTVTSGSIVFQGTDILALEPEERARLGLFMSFQYPPEIPGVSNRQFLLHTLNATRKAQGKPALSDTEFETLLAEKMAWVEMRDTFIERSVNEGFSGGEKKRNEILQLALLNPAFAILDETDSGLDIDAIRVVSCGVKRWMHPDHSLILITHYQRLLDYIRPDFVHVMVDGKIVQSGSSELALELEKSGYDPLLAKLQQGALC